MQSVFAFQSYAWITIITNVSVIFSQIFPNLVEKQFSENAQCKTFQMFLGVAPSSKSQLLPDFFKTQSQVFL